MNSESFNTITTLTTSSLNCTNELSGIFLSLFARFILTIVQDFIKFYFVFLHKFRVNTFFPKLNPTCSWSYLDLFNFSVNNALLTPVLPKIFLHASQRVRKFKTCVSLHIFEEQTTSMTGNILKHQISKK